MGKQYFSHAFFDFFRDLKKNNSRPWFEKNKARYEREVRDKLVQFVEDAAPRIKKISTYLVADPRPVGGSIFRIYRDIRFSKDKTPYKTAGALHFPHSHRDGSAPGYYLHLEPGGVYGGVGIWHPETPAVTKVRDAIVAGSGRWKRITTSKTFKDNLYVEGRSLKTVPRGYPKDHPFADDLKRTDFTAGHTFTEKEAGSSTFMDDYLDVCRAGAPFAQFIADALGIPF